MILTAGVNGIISFTEVSFRYCQFKTNLNGTFPCLTFIVMFLLL